jgi:hypothetical protein
MCRNWLPGHMLLQAGACSSPLLLGATIPPQAIAICPCQGSSSSEEQHHAQRTSVNACCCHAVPQDYTLAQYKPETFEQLAYEQTVDKLVTVLGYPKELYSFTFDDKYMCRGLVMDKVGGARLHRSPHDSPAAEAAAPVRSSNTSTFSLPTSSACASGACPTSSDHA